MANISKEKPQERSLDYEALLTEGIDLIQRYSGAIWTDYNHHDPGVTILEYLCFGITDIGYRCSFPITDLLHARKNHIPQPVDNAFLPAEKILPCAPLTADDYRNLIIDRVKGVANAWVIPVLDHKENFKGLYDIGLQLGKEPEENETPESIARAVSHLFSAHRNLCEDIRKIYFLEHHLLDIIATVHISNDASPEHVLANIIHQVERFLVPATKFHDLGEMLLRGYSLSELLDGPMPLHGFLKLSDFNLLLARFSTNQFGDIMKRVEGVTSIGQISLLKDNLPVFSNEINLSTNTFLFLNDSFLNNLQGNNHPIQLFRNGQPVRPNLLMVKQILETFAAKESPQFNPKVSLNIPQPVVEKDLSDISAYYSIQRFFPAVYGIGDYGLPRDSDFRRQAQARQLKGFLAIFEILFASYLQQLTQVKNLFSIEKKSKKENQSEKDQSYFTAFPFSIPDIENLLNTKMTDSEERQSDIQRSLDEIAAINDVPLDRRNEFLDHLLARFGESINGDFLSIINAGAEDDSAYLKKILIETKCRILQQYETLSRDRGQGFNYRSEGHLKSTNLTLGDRTITTRTTTNISGLKKRLYAWMNIENAEDRSLTDFFPFDQFRSVYAPSGSADAQAGIPLSAVLQSGKTEKSYQFSKYGTNDWDINFTGSSEAKPKKLFHLRKTSYKKAKEILVQFIESVKIFDSHCKGFFVVEHLLLRPQRTQGDMIKLVIPLENRQVVFWGIGFHDMVYLENLARGLQVIASNRQNYEVLKDGNKHFLVIKQGNNPVLVSAVSYDSATSAEKLCDQLALTVTKTLSTENPPSNTQPDSFNNWISFVAEVVKGAHVTNAFYDFRLSIVIPDWPSAFMDQDFRTQFKYMVAQHLPAHLRADLLWLDWSEMMAFENDYLDWLDAKSGENPDIQKVDELSFSLVEKLLRAENATDANSGKWRSEEEKQKKELRPLLSNQRLDALLEQFGFSFLFN